MQTFSYTDIGGRADNEDTVRIVRKGQALCAVVADGLGGHGGGAVASKAAADAVCGHWSGDVRPEELTQLVTLAHEQIQQRQTRLCAMKSTMVVLTVQKGRAAWAHAGDSRLYRFRNGALEFQTRDHSASQLAVMLGDITPDQIRFHEDRSKVLRALGQEGDLKVDTGSMALTPGRYAFLLCTDGFWEYVLEAEMEQDLAAARSPEEWVERMRRRLAQRVPANNDNNTAAAVWLEQN